MTNRLENHMCLRCGIPLVRDDKENPFHIVCTSCEEEYKKMYWAQRNKEGKPFKNVKKLRLNVLGKEMKLREAQKALDNDMPSVRK